MTDPTPTSPQPAVSVEELAETVLCSYYGSPMGEGIRNATAPLRRAIIDALLVFGKEAEAAAREQRAEELLEANTIIATQRREIERLKRMNDCQQLSNADGEAEAHASGKAEGKREAREEDCRTLCAGCAAGHPTKERPKSVLTGDTALWHVSAHSRDYLFPCRAAAIRAQGGGVRWTTLPTN